MKHALLLLMLLLLNDEAWTFARRLVVATEEVNATAADMTVHKTTAVIQFVMVNGNACIVCCVHVCMYNNISVFAVVFIGGCRMYSVRCISGTRSADYGCLNAIYFDTWNRHLRTFWF